MLKVEKIDVQTKSGKNILSDFSLAIKPGEVHAIMGPNGTGKSTLSKVLMGHPDYIVTSGEVLFEGENLLKLSVDERARKGIFLANQNPISIDGVSNSEFLKTALSSVSSQNVGIYQFMKKMEQAMKELKMSDSFMHRSINQDFSGGERKKNEILQMKILEPKLIILDELDSGLDVDSLKIVCENINAYKLEHPSSSLIITHYTRILDYIHPDFVHVQKDGQIIASGDMSLARKIEKEGYDGGKSHDKGMMVVNKLLLSQVIKIEKDGFYYLELNPDCANTKIEVLKDVAAKLFIYGEDTEASLEISILEGANVLVQTFGSNLNMEVSSILKEENAHFTFIYSLSNKKHSLKVSIHHLASFTTSKVINHIVHAEDKAFIQVDAIVPKGCIQTEVKQDNKIILLDGGVGEIKPNLYISEFDCFAEHSAYVSKFPKESLFYLKMRGIREAEANFLLMKSFLLGNMDLPDGKFAELIQIIRKFER